MKNHLYKVKYAKHRNKCNEESLNLLKVISLMLVRSAVLKSSIVRVKHATLSFCQYHLLDITYYFTPQPQTLPMNRQIPAAFMVLSPVTEDELKHIIKKLLPKKSNNLNLISTCLVKECSSNIPQPLTKEINIIHFRQKS